MIYHHALLDLYNYRAFERLKRAMFHCFNLGLALRSLRYKLVCVYIMKRLEFEPQGGAFPNETSLSTSPSGGGLITPPNL